ncbi:MAG: hypothetical protein IT210_07165 [Armatimonadetes bacterium]|nr:hypothetical protein [Armatimonadota bacterium]
MNIAWIVARSLGQKIVVRRLALLFLDAAALGLGAQLGKHAADVLNETLWKKDEAAQSD